MATVTPFVLPSTQDYGLDLDALSDLTSNMNEVTGRLLLGQALARRISTDRGTVIDDPNYGYDVTGEVNDDVSTKDIGRIAAQIDAEFKKDARVVDSKTTAQLVSGQLIVTSALRDGIGPFKLVLAASNVDVKILSVGS